MTAAQITQVIDTDLDPPTTTDPLNFDARADAWNGVQIPQLANELNAFGTQANALSTDVNAKSINATTQATNAAASALAAANSATLVNFVGQWSLLTGALDIPASVVHEGVYYALQVYLADVTASEPGITADWAPINQFTIETRTTMVQFAPIDFGKIVEFTTTGFTQTFGDPDDLGNGWYLHVKNASTGLLTISAPVDGLTSFVMYPGEMRMFFCNGISFKSYVVQAFEYDFDSSGNFTKPPGYRKFAGYAWGGGGGGVTSYGGGGGGCTPFERASADFSATETVTVAAGGASGASGGNTSLGSLVVAYGGAGASGGGDYAGGGGGILGAASTFSGGPPNSLGDNNFGGGNGTSISPAGSTSRSVYGGGGGNTGGAGSLSIWGGGGGGKTGGASVYAGAGGGTDVNGTAPAGGGGSGTTSGGAGRVRIRGIF